MDFRAICIGLLMLLVTLGACDKQTPNSDGGTGGPEGMECLLPASAESLSSCLVPGGDYRPREPGADSFPSCGADDGTFHLVGTGTPSAAARSEALDAMAARLWGNSAALTAEDFVAARDLYSTAQGIGSRVERRQDIHHPELPGTDKFACAQAGIPEQYPDRCAGPGRILPIVLDAFQRGILLDEPRVQAERLEAALLWFFYLSTLSEIWTSGIDKAADADSAWGYFDGARPRGAPIGMAAMMSASAPATYDRGYDAILGVSCWRELDNTMPFSNVDLYSRVQAQVDRALLRGLAVILRERLRRLDCATGQYRAAHLEFARLLGGFLDRESSSRAPAEAATLRTELAKVDADAVDTARAIAALNALYACP